MLCKSIVSDICQGIKIAEKNSASTVWSHMNVGILKICKSTLCWECTKVDQKSTVRTYYFTELQLRDGIASKERPKADLSEKVSNAPKGQFSDFFGGTRKNLSTYQYMTIVAILPPEMCSSPLQRPSQ